MCVCLCVSGCVRVRGCFGVCVPVCSTSVRVCGMCMCACNPGICLEMITKMILKGVGEMSLTVPRIRQAKCNWIHFVCHASKS